MLPRILLFALCLLMVASAIYSDPSRRRSLLGSRPAEGPRLRLITWNIGYAELEDDSRAHTKDLQLVAGTLLHHDPDVVALQELTGPEQLKVLLGHLHGRYVGAVASLGDSDRVAAVLVKDRSARFENLAASEKYYVAATLQTRPQSPKIILVSAHADAFSSARRRAFIGDVIDWSRNQSRDSVVFICGDFNFELDAKNGSHLYTDNVKNDSEAYSYILKYFRDLGRDSGNTAVNDRRIDYVFGPPEKAFVRRVEVLRGAGAEQMDHWPLLVEVVL